ncbi:hypothetical protein AHF37_00034 [Paragonimus kellicotti]|nr:hypothetical protein AHF37_00034 [Paragonimus kellicotti]
MAGSVTIEATTHRRDQALVENTRTETQRVSSSNVLGSPYEELDSPLKQSSGHTNIKSVSKRSTMNEKNKKEARKYRSSAQKTILLSVMTSEQINSDTAMQNNPDDNFVKNAIPERLKKSVAQHIPYRRSLDSRTNGEILESNVIRDVRSSSLQEPTMHPVRSIHRRTASRESPVSEELNQQGFTVTDPSCQSVWQYEKPAGDLVETQDTPNADKTAIRAEKPSRLLAISKLTFSRQLSEYTIDTDENSAETVSSVEEKKQQTENQHVAGPTIVIHRARSATSEHTEVRNIHTARTSISRCAQTPDSGPVVWYHNHRKRRNKLSFSNKTKRELHKLSSEFLLHNRSKKHSEHNKNISVTWSHNSRQLTSQVSPVSDYSDERLSMAHNEIPPLESAEGLSQQSQPHSYSPDRSRSLTRPEQSEEISLSVCITQKTDSSSSLCSTLTPSSSLERIMRRKFRRLLYRSNKQRRKRKGGAPVHREYEVPQCYSEDSISTSSMYSNESWQPCNSKRRCRSQRPDVCHKRKYCSSAMIPKVFRLFRLSSSLKDLSTRLIHRELKYLLIKRLLLRRALAERLVSQLIHTHRC